jgi:mannose-6-phosphate isomerase-like protein (cupin superfamily)
MRKRRSLLGLSDAGKKKRDLIEARTGGITLLLDQDQSALNSWPADMWQYYSFRPREKAMKETVVLHLSVLLVALNPTLSLLAEGASDTDLGPAFVSMTEGQLPTLEIKRLSEEYDYLAPDGSEVRLLVEGTRASMAQFKLPAGHTSSAVAHRTVEELWYVVSGRGQMWRKTESDEDIVHLLPGVSLSIPQGAHFQFRTVGEETLEVIGVTVPAWPGTDEAYPVEGKWPVSHSSDQDEQ